MYAFSALVRLRGDRFVCTYVPHLCLVAFSDRLPTVPFSFPVLLGCCAPPIVLSRLYYHPSDLDRCRPPSVMRTSPTRRRYAVSSPTPILLFACHAPILYQSPSVALVRYCTRACTRPSDLDQRRQFPRRAHTLKSASFDEISPSYKPARLRRAPTYAPTDPPSRLRPACGHRPQRPSPFPRRLDDGRHLSYCRATALSLLSNLSTLPSSFVRSPSAPRPGTSI